MKKLALLIGLVLVLQSCSDSTFNPVGDNVFLHEAIQACGMETDKQFNETPPEWAERILIILDNNGVDVDGSMLDFKELEICEGFCGNCAPTGDRLLIDADLSFAPTLEALGFVLQ